MYHGAVLEISISRVEECQEGLGPGPKAFPVNYNTTTECGLSGGVMLKMKTDVQRAVLAVVVTVGTLWSMTMVGQDTASLYKTKCATCHGADGKGGTPVGKKLGLRDFSSPEVQKMSDAELTTIIADGKGKMPGYKKSLKPEQIKDLTAFVRELAKKK
jgi:cytochrome c553